jgi:hypothetical protein
MNIEKDIHPSIRAALNGQAYESQEMETTFDDGEQLTVNRFTFGGDEPTLIVAIKAIIELSENSALSNEFFFEAEEPLNYVSNRLSLTNEQSLMLSLVVAHFTDQRIDVTDFGSHLRCSPITLLPYLKEMNVLEERGLIVCNHSGNRPSYRIPYYILEAINDNRVPETNNLTDLTCQELFDELENIFDLRIEHEITYEGLINRTQSLLNSNKELQMVKQVYSYALNDNDQVVLLFIASQFVNHRDEIIILRQLNQLFDHRGKWSNLHQQLQNEKNRLQELELIEFVHEGGFGDHNAFCLSMAAKRALLSELDIDLTQEDRPCRGVTSYKDIVARQLFYDASTSLQVDELAQLLSEKNYQQIRQRLQENGFRSGFTCLFYGTPGTGKTETVLQLARQTGRDIVQVNVSEIKSKWVGDSEKNIKALFDDYRRKVKDRPTTPILLFNEADAIINRRQEQAEHSVDKMENSIQNIILQEMETLDGILIATTNLEQNMDKAFERRFLYKIKFNKPTAEARQNIWKSMIPSLSSEAVSQLAHRYDFSGGQIENVARHYTIDSILHGDKANDLQALISHCDQERLEKQLPRMGF